MLNSHISCFSTIGTPAELKYTLQTYGIPASIFPVTDDGQILKEFDLVRWSQRRLEERILRQRQLAAKDGRYPTTSKTQRFLSPTANGLVPFSSKRLLSNAITSEDVDSTGYSNTIPASPAGVESVTTESEEVKKSTRVLTPGNNDVLHGRGRLSQLHVGNIRFRLLIDQHQESYDAASRIEKTRMAAALVKLVKSKNGRFLKEEGSAWVEVEDSVSRIKVANCFRTTRHRRKKINSGIF